MWEYRWIEAEDCLADLGEQGWELNAACSQEGGRTRFYLKRPMRLVERFTAEQRERALSGSEDAADRGQSSEVTVPLTSALLNAPLAALVRRLGHTDMLLLADKGFPIPELPHYLDLALSPGIPTIPQVIAAVRSDFSFDRVLIASEMSSASPGRVEELREALPDVPVEAMPHTTFKRVAATARGAVRTGDTAPYANLILVCG